MHDGTSKDGLVHLLIHHARNIRPSRNGYHSGHHDVTCVQEFLSLDYNPAEALVEQMLVPARAYIGRTRRSSNGMAKEDNRSPLSNST